MGNMALSFDWMSRLKEEEVWGSLGEGQLIGTRDGPLPLVMPKSRWRCESGIPERGVGKFKLVPSHWCTNSGKEGA